MTTNKHFGFNCSTLTVDQRIKIIIDGALINLDNEVYITINTDDGALIELKPPRYRSGIN